MSTKWSEMKDPEMTVRDAAAILNLFNKWRRSNGNLPMPNPHYVGQAIDLAVRELNRRLEDVK